MHKINIDEDFSFLTVYVTVTVTPEPSYHGDVARHAIFADQAKYAVYWEWPSNGKPSFTF